MANWIGVITNGGNDLLNEWVSERELRFDSAAAGSGTVAVASMMAQTALAAQKQEASILGADKVDGGVRLKLRVSAHETGYTLNQYGVWASLTGGDSILVALFQHEQGIQVPSKNESPDFVYTFYALIGCSNTGTWTVNIDTSAVVSGAEMDRAIAEATNGMQPKITTSGLLKGDGKGNITAAAGGTDYAWPTLSGSGAPTETTKGETMQRYHDTATDKEYVCTGKSADGKYVWKLSGGGDEVPAHASNHATGGSDPITPASIGAAQRIINSPNIADLLEWASAQTQSGAFYVDPSVVTVNTPEPGVWFNGFIEVGIAGPGRITLSINDHAAKTYVNCVSSGAWQGWAMQYSDTVRPKPNDIGAAPDGFGLGANTARLITDGNDALVGGWFYWGNIDTNLPFTYGHMRVDPRLSSSKGQILMQTAYSDGYPGCVAQRKMMDGAFKPWEWVNPPMVTGTEYRTTERCQNKSVYKKLDTDGAIKWRLDGEDTWHSDKPISKSVTLSASGWDSSAKTQTITVAGVLADETKQLITPTPALASQVAYYEAVVLCTGQSADKLTFTAKKIPTDDLTVYVTIQEVGA